MRSSNQNSLGYFSDEKIVLKREVVSSGNKVNILTILNMFGTEKYYSKKKNKLKKLK